MNNLNPQTIYLKDYTPPNFAINRIDLEFTLGETETIVKNTMQVERINAAAADLELDGNNLELQSILLNNEIVNSNSYQILKEKLIVYKVPDTFTLEITTKIKPQENTQLSGLYRTNGLFCTQCEAQGFRRISYFLDRPDVLTRYTTKIIADKQQYPVLLSNGNLIEQGQDGNQHWAVWQDPFKKPSYLFALVAGKLNFIEDNFMTRSGRTVNLKLYVEPGNEDKCSHAMESLKKAMRWDEIKFGREYDLEIFMIVAVSDFNMGAMENKGLNIFNDKYILARPDSATDADFIAIESVVGHEYFHNWTGNRITCRDWFQLSLKEGLTIFRDQEFTRDMNSRDVNRIQDVAVLRNQQFPEDSSPMAHPVRPESYIEINNFYTATVYNKGAEVIRMQHTLLGEEGFRKGMDLYFSRHDGQAVTIDDFVAAMEDANQVDFSQLKRWYSQAGTPRVTGKIDYNNTAQRLTLHLQQHLPQIPTLATPMPLTIPIQFALFDQKGENLAHDQKLLVLSEATQQFTFDNISERPVVSLLRDFSAPIILEIDYSDAELQFLMQHETNGFSRWEAAQRFANKYLQQLIDKTFTLPSEILNPYRTILTSDMDLSLQAEILTLPRFNDLANFRKQIVVDAIVNALDDYTEFLGNNLYDHFKQNYESLQRNNSKEMNSKVYAERKMKNACLSYMIFSNNSEAIKLCYQQFNSALTMTDEISSLGLLAHINCDERSDALQRFYSKWQHDKLVLDKWFAVQAISRLPNTLTEIEQLLNHPDFNLNNPNKVRAVVGSFCMHNQRNFHKLDGSGYQFLADFIKKIDKNNPQLAANLVTPLIRWRHYDEKRKHLMHNALSEIMQQTSLSKDVYEKVSKSM